MSHALSYPKSEATQPTQTVAIFGINTAPGKSQSTEQPLLNSLRSLRSQLCVFHLLVLLILSIFLCFYDLGTGANMGNGTGIDESWYIQTAQEMQASGRWWLPTREDQIFFYKPPLKFWLTEVSSYLFGGTIESYRYIDAALGVSYVLLCYFAAAYFFNSLSAGFFSALALMSCPNFFFANGVRNNTLDPQMTFLSSVALLMLWYFTEQRRETLTTREQVVRGGIIGTIVGLSALTKSVAAYYLFGIYGLWVLLTGNLGFCWYRRRALLVTTGIVAVALLGLWVLPHAVFTPGAWRVMFGYELKGRFTRGFHHSTERYFYWKLFLRNRLLPPLTCCLAFAWAALNLFSRERSRYLLLALWVLLPFGVFSLLPSRLEWYVFPCFFPMALLCGAALGRAFESAAASAFVLRTQAGSAALGLVLLKLLLSTSLAGAMLAPIGRSITEIADRVYTGQPRLAIDQVVVGIRQIKPVLERDTVVLYNSPPFATRERIFFNMIKGGSVTLTSVEDLVERVRSGRLGFYFTDFDGAQRIVSLVPDARYRELPPVTFPQAHDGILRRLPLVVVAVGVSKNQESMLAGFRSATQVIPLLGNVKCRYDSFDVPSADGSDKRSKGARNRGYETVCTIEGDHLLNRSPTSVALNHSTLLASVKEGGLLQLFIGSKLVGETADLNQPGGHFRFQIPPQSWRSGANNLGIRVTLRDGSLATEPSHKRPLFDWVTVNY